MYDIAAEGAKVLALITVVEASMQDAVNVLLKWRSPRMRAGKQRRLAGSAGAIEDVPLDEARRQFEVKAYLARLS
jgi:hypothetical protein